MTRTILHSDRAPKAIGPYSQAVRAGDTLYLSGQTPLDPSSGELVAGDISAQATQVFGNLEAVLAAAGATFDDVVMLRVYLTKREDFPTMNDAYGAFVAQHTTKGVLPSRTTVFTGLPREEMLVEIDAFAVLS